MKEEKPSFLFDKTVHVLGMKDGNYIYALTIVGLSCCK